MAVTAQALQASADSANTLNVFIVTQGPLSLDATYDAFYCVGKGEPYAGRSMWCATTKAGNAAAQVVEVKAALAAGPFDANVVTPG